MRLVVGVERADVAPVGLVAFGRAGNLVGGEVVDLPIAATTKLGMMSPPMS